MEVIPFNIDEISQDMDFVHGVLQLLVDCLVESAHDGFSDPGTIAEVVGTAETKVKIFRDMMRRHGSRIQEAVNQAEQASESLLDVAERLDHYWMEYVVKEDAEPDLESKRKLYSELLRMTGFILFPDHQEITTEFKKQIVAAYHALLERKTPAPDCEGMLRFVRPHVKGPKNLSLRGSDGERIKPTV